MKETRVRDRERWHSRAGDVLPMISTAEVSKRESVDRITKQPGAGLPTAFLLFAAAAILAVRLVALNIYPAAAADEGNWPIAVRHWLTAPNPPYEYFTAPLYHWLLGIPFALFGPSLLVGRVTSALFGLGALALLYGVARRLFNDREIAIWSVLLAGTSYAIVLIDRRSLVEPMQMFMLLALVFFALGRSTVDRVGVVLSLAAVLLTKANAIFIIPALVLTTFLDGRNGRVREAGKTALLLTVGTLLAAGVFLIFYLMDPALFLRGWAPGMVADVYDASSPTGRLALAPVQFFERLHAIGGEEPFLLAFGFAAAIRQVLVRKYWVLSAWLLFGLAFFAVQEYWLENHLAVIYPPLVLGTAWVLVELGRAAAAARGIAWSRAVLGLIIAYSFIRLLGAMATTRDPVAPAVAWLHENAAPTDTVLAAPHILMQWPGPVVNMFELRPTMLPDPARLRARGVQWVVMDQREWANYIARVPTAEVRSVFDACCSRVFDVPGAATIYRVK